jgi:hypothetical protein
MAGPHDWDWASPTTATTPVSSPGGGHPGGWAHEPSQTFSTPPQVTTPPVQTGTPTPELPAITTSTGSTVHPWDAVGDTSSPLINVSQVGGGPNNPGSLLYGINLADYGFNPKDEFLPQDFLDSLFEGSVVSGNEAVESTEPNIGTWSDVEAGNHPLFPGGLEDYYDPYGNLGNAWHEPSGGPGWEGYDRDLLAERRAWQEGLFYGPKVAPQRNIEAQGFFNTLGSKIRNPFLEAVGETLAINPEGRSGLYGKMVHHAKLPTPWGLEREYATGRARGGIVSAWKNRR